jgi:hypothetical protein
MQLENDTGVSRLTTGSQWNELGGDTWSDLLFHAAYDVGY